MDATFEIDNKGDQPLQIGKVVPGCGCTSVKISDHTIAPGGNAKVTAILSLRLQRGDVRKQVTIESNDPQTPIYNVYLVGTATSPISIIPDKLFFGVVDINDLAERTVDLVAPTAEKAFHVIDAASGDPKGFSVSCEELESGKHYRLHIRMTQAVMPGDLMTYVTVRTDSQQFPAFGVPITVTVRGDLALAPTEFSLIQLNKPGRPLTRYIVLTSGRVNTFHVLSVECPDPAMKSEVAVLGDSIYRIRISNIMPSVKLNKKDIIIKTDLPSLPEVRVVLKVQPEGHPPITTQPSGGAVG